MPSKEFSSIIQPWSAKNRPSCTPTAILCFLYSGPAALSAQGFPGHPASRLFFRSPSCISSSPAGQADYSFTVWPPRGVAHAGLIRFSATGLSTGATTTISPASVPGGAGTTTVTMAVRNTADLQPPCRPSRGGTLPVALERILLKFAGRLRRPGECVRRECGCALSPMPDHYLQNSES